MSSARRLTIQTLLLSSGRLLTALATVLITGVLTRHLDTREYATVRQVLLLAALGLPLLTLGLPQAPLHLLPGAAPRRARGIVTENLALLTLLGLLFGLAMLSPLGALWTARFENPALAGALWVLVPYCLGWFPIQSLGGVLVPANRAKLLMMHNMGAHLLLLAGILTATFLSGSAQTVLLVYAAWAVLMGVWGVYIMGLVTPAPGGPWWGDAHWGGLKAQLRFGLPLGLATLLTGLSTQLDKYLVGILCSERDFAIYVTGALEVPLVAVITGAISMVVVPDFKLHHRAGEPEKILALWQSAMRASMLFLAPIFFGVLLFGPDIARVLFGAEYVEAGRPMRIYALMLPLRAAVYGSVLIATERARWVTISALVGLVLNALLSWVAIHFIGPDGAAWASVLSIYGVVAVLLFPMGEALRCPPHRLIRWRENLQVLAVAGLPVLALWPLLGRFSEPGAVRLLTLGALYTLAVALLYPLFKIATLRQLLALLRRPS